MQRICLADITRPILSSLIEYQALQSCICVCVSKYTKTSNKTQSQNGEYEKQTPLKELSVCWHLNAIPNLMEWKIKPMLQFESEMLL